ncbi:MAG: L,D-transpeptidase [Acidobacteria bacterium]|nr:L,D-transpeptidase [Acidobacteriota bacterium]
MRRLALLLLATLLVAATGLSLPQEGPPPEPPPPSEPPAPPPTDSQVVGQEQQPTPEETLPVAEPEPPPPSEPRAPQPRKPRPKKPLTLEQKHDELVKSLAGIAPKGIYLLIDTGTNRLYLMRNRCVLRAAVCSTGSGRFLPDPPRNREWTFDTPKGEFKIRRKVVNPVWIKPDWAFIEEGEAIPRKQQDRLAPEELGDYAMDLGDGYLIHGTLYERSLGMSVTHGCVRLGAKDLEAVFKSVRIGTPVYIF